METILNLVLIVGAQLIVYVVLLRPRVMTWGATTDEATGPLIGDELVPRSSATRAVTVNAPIAEAWHGIIQLGADRGGFFSYAFLEKLLGYEMYAPGSVPDADEMAVGRIIPASLDESKSFIKYNFPVVAVEPGRAFVLGSWGAFVLKPLSPTQTRLIVRTHGQELPTLWSRIEDFIGMAAHYVMERRMLLGLKAQIETGTNLPALADNLWLVGLVLSALGIALIVLLGSGLAAIVLSVLYGIAWLWVLLIGDPRAPFSLILFLLIAATLIWL